ncbi:PEP/pyruvate-binding domain-containing protein [Plantactinospora sp. BB1]|uniref:PEP/pyruvate-binding domain-containing protein n=1 Tax=Plantactinospora sp. BB1 TaxID=2071627 RepID=UPI000D178259|nr:PEP/pyruvate-binding domain-containing protein [Plantactinospora sp. BB1]AVT37788.1 phosphoenolpyruvate synthase [Plantactinospora sp. BB1]
MRRIVTGRHLRAVAAVGPKFARQAEMAAAGLPVPPFFCLSTRCYTEILRPHQPEIADRLGRIDYSDPASLAEHAAALRSLVADATIPADLAAATLRTFDTTFGPDAVVAVRASAVGAAPGDSEDSTDDAFAGLSDSFLYVTRDRLLERVRHCWASAFNPESLLYRHAVAGGRAAPADTGRPAVAMAVGVQRMVFGERSFVLFTADPRLGSRDTVIAAGHGIGEGIVQEKVPVDHYFVDRATGEVRSHVAERAEAPGPVLRGSRLTELVRLGHRIEDLFGVPQDIEGTITADGRVHVLQSRPIVLDWARQRLWSNANITESFPGVSTVLTYSFAQRFYRAIFTDLYRRFGMSAAELRRREPDLDRMIGRLRGRIYYSLSAWYRLHRGTALFPLWRAAWERMMGLERTAPDARRDRLPGTPTGIYRSVLAGLRLAGLAVTHDRAMRDFGRWWAGVAGPRRGCPLDSTDPLGLIDDFHHVWAEVGRHWGRTLVNDLLLTSTAGATTALFARWLPDADPGLLSDLLCGDEENQSIRALMSIVDIAERVRADPRLAAAVARGPDDEVWHAMAGGAYGDALALRLHEHVERYGDRGLHELKLEQANPRQRPEQLVRVIRSYAEQSMTVAGLRDAERAARDRGDRRLAELLGTGSPRRLILAVLLARQRRYIRYREDSRYSRSELFGYAKRTFSALGDALAARGVLADPADVVHLTQDEIFGYFDGTGSTDQLDALVAVRRAEYERSGPELPMHFATMGPVRDTWPDPGRDPTPVNGDGAGGRAQLRGLGSSSGRVRGTARVVRDPHARVDGCDDMILIARETDPGWLFLMMSARGIVVERGTMLSHTAITGRKFGIPTVVSVPGATDRIPDGAPIEIDGAEGTVTLLEEA